MEGRKKSYAMNISYLERLMKNKGYNQRTLAKAVPCSSNMVHRWVNGKSKITARKLVQLARVLEVDPCALLETDDRRTIKYLRDLINRRIEFDREEAKQKGKDLPLHDIQVILQMMRTLGYDQKSENKDTFNMEEFNIERLEAENQMENLMDLDDQE